MKAGQPRPAPRGRLAAAFACLGMISFAAGAAPTVWFTAPSDGQTISGNLYQSSACEVTGSNINQVVFYLNTTQLNTENYVPWNCNLDTTKFADGTHTLRAVAYDSAGASASTQISVKIQNSSTSSSTSPEVQFFCTFSNSPTDCGFREQAKEPGRATLVNFGRDGSTAVRLHTKPGDDGVNGSGTWERNDLTLNQTTTDCYEGREQWWAHSIFFPDDYVSPPAGGGGVVADFHHTGSSGQANFHVDAMPDSMGLRLRGFGGATVNSGRYEVVLGPVVRNIWYDFVYHVKWSSGTDGFFNAWVNGEQKLAHRGPTLYEGQGCYFKLANYHSPFGEASSVIHDRVVRGTTRESVWPTSSAASTNQAPTVAFKAPTEGQTLSGSIVQSSACEVDARDDKGVKQVQFFLGTTALNTEYLAPWNCDIDTRNFPDGTHVLSALATDSDGATGSAQVSISIQNTSLAEPEPAPVPEPEPALSVAFKAPTQGDTLSGTIRKSSACEAEGSGIARVEFFLGDRRLNTARSAPWYCDIDTRKFANGTHTLRAVANGASGAPASAEILIQIENGTTRSAAK
jgi:hypothetical protein